MPFFAVRPQSKQGICVWAKDIDCAHVRVFGAVTRFPRDAPVLVSRAGLCVFFLSMVVLSGGGPSDDPKAYIVVDLSGRYDEYARTVLSTFVFGEDVELSSRRSQLATLYTLINEPASFLKGVAAHFSVF